MTVHFTTIDCVIIAGYCLAMLLIGVMFSRSQHTVRAFLLGDNSASWWLVLFSIVTTETSAVTFLSVTGKGFGTWDPVSHFYRPGNLTFLQLALGYLIGRIVISLWLLPLYFRGELYSAYEVLKQRFGETVQKAASLIFLLTRTVADGLRLYLASLFLSGCLNISIHSAITAIVLVTLIYTWFGGIKAILWTDLIQFVIKIGAAILALVIIAQSFPGGISHLFSEAHNYNQMQLFNWSFDWSLSQTIWAGVIGGAFVSMATHGADQMMVQRYLCSKTLRSAQIAVISSGIVVLLQFSLFLVVGMGFYHLMSQQILTVPQETPADQIFALFLASELMPTGLRGLFVAAVLASAMSTLSASWNSAASTLIFDFYKSWKPNAREATLLDLARVATLISCLFQTGIALLACIWMTDKAVIDVVMELAGLTLGLLLGLFVLGSLRQRVSSRSALIGISAALLVVLTLYLSKFAGYGIGWPWYTPIGTLTTVVIGLIGERPRIVRQSS